MGKQGSRRVQEALKEAANEAVREELVSKLKGHVLEAMVCPHANFVLQKSIELSPAHSLQFVVDELKASNSVTRAARHKYACRILQRLFEHCCLDQIRDLV